MSKILSIFTIFMVFSCMLVAGTIGPDLQMALAQEEGHLPVIISLKQDISVKDIKNTYRGLSKRDVFALLKSECQDKQAYISSLSARLIAEGSVKNIKFLWIANAVSIEATKAAIEELALQPEIDVISLDRIQTMLQPMGSVAERDIPWGLSYIKSREVNAQGFRGQGVTVAVVDTGIDLDHSAFTPGQILVNECKSFVVGEDTAEDGNGHGTHCAGTIASQLYGVAPDANIIAVKVLSASGSGSWTGVMQGVEYAAERAEIISMSLGGRANPNGNVVEQAVENAIDNGVIVVIAAGNDGPFAQTIGTPGVVQKAITVGAIDETGELAYFSSRGQTVYYHNKPDMVAPGVDVLSTWKDNGTNTISGTSMATPHVAGVVALILGKAKGTSPEGAKNVLMATTSGTKKLNWYGEGTIQCDKAMSKIGSTDDFVEENLLLRENGTFKIEAMTNGAGELVINKTVGVPGQVTIQKMYSNAAYQDFTMSINKANVWAKGLKVAPRVFYDINKAVSGSVDISINAKNGPANALVRILFSCSSSRNETVQENTNATQVSITRADSGSISIIGQTGAKGKLVITETFTVPVGAEILDIYCNAAYEKADLILNGKKIWEKGIAKIQPRVFYPVNAKFPEGGEVSFQLTADNGPASNTKVKFLLRYLTK